MCETPPRSGIDNAAWVTIPTKLSADNLLEFCSNVENLYRLNPYIKILSWHAYSRDTVHVDWENHSKDASIRCTTQFELAHTSNEIQQTYLSGNKRITSFIIESNKNGAQLTIIDDYGDSKETGSVDKSLSAWGQSLKRFFDHYLYLRHIPFAKSIIERYWIRLSPFARRVSYILVVLAFVELVALLLFVLLLRFL